MATVIWEPVRSRRCDRVGEWVRLEVRVVYPTELLPDQPPRVLAHRCSHAMECSTIDRPTCGWAGTWPGHDPML